LSIEGKIRFIGIFYSVNIIPKFIYTLSLLVLLAESNIIRELLLNKRTCLQLVILRYRSPFDIRNPLEVKLTRTGHIGGSYMPNNTVHHTNTKALVKCCIVNQNTRNILLQPQEGLAASLNLLNPKLISRESVAVW
jgi:hypothetical protein